MKMHLDFILFFSPHNFGLSQIHCIFSELRAPVIQLQCLGAQFHLQLENQGVF